VATLRRLHAARFEIAAVVTQPDRPKGRGLAPAPSPVKVAALELGLLVEQPEKLKGAEGRGLLERHRPDAVVIVGYGQIIPADLLALPRLGWINLHGSLLPKYRGAAPVQWAILNGESVTGVTTMQLEAGLDTGPILLQAEEAIRADDTPLTLGPRLAARGAELMVETLRGLERGALAPKPQDDSQASQAPLLKKDDGRLDWTQPARAVANRVRGLQPWPGAFTGFRGQLLHVWSARAVEAPPGVVQAPAPGTLLAEKRALYVACGESSWLELLELQPANRKRMPAADFLHGFHLHSGEHFES